MNKHACIGIGTVLPPLNILTPKIGAPKLKMLIFYEMVLMVWNMSVMYGD
jgi:hypothetical protein